MKKRLTYKSSGVDISEGERLVKLIKPLASRTSRSGVIAGIGGFGALFSGRFKGLRDPVLVSATDGVGTKLMVAFMTGRHSTVGRDLVAMSVNDIVTTGAEPLFFLDYLATGRLDARRASSIIKGIAAGCREAGCALVGGETAEMPGMYSPGEYDLAGFAVGVVDRKKIIDGSAVRAGDALIGLRSSGLHSNGYSLARKVLFDKLGLGLKDKPRGLGKTVSAELLTPTRIYVKPILKLMKDFKIRGIAHITGGGLTENVPRILPKGVKAVIDKSSWPLPPVFKLIRDGGGISEAEMLRTFNCGIGMVLVVRSAESRAVVKKLERMGEKARAIGVVAGKGRGRPAVEFV
ncbi:MAG: phosphoribosylformylglycinamidine cyclo-ligase [Thermodesulfobacteriota bacterium]